MTLRFVRYERERLERRMKGTLVRVERGKEYVNRCKKEEKRKQRRGRGGDGLFCQFAGWRVARKIRLCCIERDWSAAYWEREKREVTVRG